MKKKCIFFILLLCGLFFLFLREVNWEVKMVLFVIIWINKFVMRVRSLINWYENMDSLVIIVFSCLGVVFCLCCYI